MNKKPRNSSAETLPQCFVALEKLKFAKKTQTKAPSQRIGMKRHLITPEVIYVPDSDEEISMVSQQHSKDSESDLGSNSDTSHVRKMGVLMIAKHNN